MIQDQEPDEWSGRFGVWSKRINLDTSCEAIEFWLQDKNCLEFVVSAAFESLERVFKPAYDISVTEPNVPVRNYADIIKALDAVAEVKSTVLDGIIQDEKADIYQEFKSIEPEAIQSETEEVPEPDAVISQNVFKLS